MKKVSIVFLIFAYLHCYSGCSTTKTFHFSGSELTHSSEGSLLKQVSATHHEPYIIRMTASGPVLEPAEMREHDDIQIFECMYRLERNVTD